MTHAPILPGQTIGVVGGGQLGRMMALAARRMGYRIVVLDPNPRCPTAQVSDGVVVGALDDMEAAILLAKQVDVVTLDTEHVPAEILDAIEQHAPVRPGPSVLRTIQDRQVQKQFLDQLGVPQAAWAPVDSELGLRASLEVFGGQGIIKHRRSGYDGKGQLRVDKISEASNAWNWLRGTEAVIEDIVPFTREISRSRPTSSSPRRAPTPTGSSR